MLHVATRSSAGNAFEGITIGIHKAERIRKTSGGICIHRGPQASFCIADCPAADAGLLRKLLLSQAGCLPETLQPRSKLLGHQPMLSR